MKGEEGRTRRDETGGKQKERIDEKLKEEEEVEIEGKSMINE